MALNDKSITFMKSKQKVHKYHLLNSQTCGISEGMSESYHEIFDTLMPPETAKAKIQSENVQTPDRLADSPSIQPATSSILPGLFFTF